MERQKSEILSVVSLEIGYQRGKIRGSICPPLSASAADGELIALIGRNGIGKSTLLRTITGLQPSFGGKILLKGNSISTFSRMELARKIGFISTELVRISNMRVVDLVALGRFPHTNWMGRIDSASEEAINEAVSKTGISDLKYRYINELSDGERQRAMIARVLAQDTDIIVMDEPMAFLDIISKYEIINLMSDLTGEGKTIIFSTHDFNLAINNADKIWLMPGDKLIEGAPEDLMLRNEFDNMFKASIEGFNPADGSFNIRRKFYGNIFIQGDGLNREWTEKAVRRAGFEVSASKTDIFIKIPSDRNPVWTIYSNTESQHFVSLYEMIKNLRNLIRKIT